MEPLGNSRVMEEVLGMQTDWVPVAFFTVSLSMSAERASSSRGVFTFMAVFEALVDVVDGISYGDIAKCLSTD